MSEEKEILKKRFAELAKKSRNCGYFLFSDFLSLNELSLLGEAVRPLLPLPYKIWGGAEGAERVMVRFGDEEELGYEEPFPILCIKIKPLMQKFADKLTHRDFLGALLNIGIERSVIGDIVIRENTGYVFAKEDMSEYICRELTRVKRTAVKTSVCENIPTGELYKLEDRTVQLSGERLDAVVAKLFSLSRDDALTLFRKKRVFVQGRCIENNDYRPKENDLVSVRGYGRFIYCGTYSTSRKGKLNVLLKLYV